MGHKLHITIFFTALYMFQYYLCDDTEFEIPLENYRRFQEFQEFCSAQPKKLRNCLPKQNEVKRTAFDDCGIKDGHVSESDCKAYQCVYDNLGTPESPGPYRQYVEEYGKANPIMADVLNDAVNNCTGVKLRPQGVLTNCSAYDVHACIDKNVIKNMPASLWREECTKERDYVARCNSCPFGCRTIIVPGTCFACDDF